VNEFERQAIARAVRRIKLRMMVRRACYAGGVVLIVVLAIANHSQLAEQADALVALLR